MKTLIATFLVFLFLMVTKPSPQLRCKTYDLPQLNATDSLLKAVQRLEKNARKLEKYTK